MEARRAEVKAVAKNGNGFGLGLGAAASMWPTATVKTGAQTAESPTPGQTGGTSLAGAAEKLWPTPSAAQDTKGAQADARAVLDRSGKHQIGLADATLLFSRPAPETQPLGPTLSQLRQIWHPLRASLIASHGRAVWRRLWASREKARLNPIFVSWLMGWPPGHALCASSGTEWFRWQQDMRGALCRLPTASGAWIWKPPAEQKAQVQHELF